MDSKQVETLEVPQSHGILKIVVYHYRHPSISEDTYQKYWSEKHSKVAVPWLERNGILGYKQRAMQYHTPSKLRNLLSSLTDEGTMELADYDGYAEFYVKSAQDLENALRDPQYLHTVVADEEEFIDKSRLKITIGWEEVYIHNGKIVA